MLHHKRKRGQVWIETVLYIIIGLAIIGIVLAVVMPKINESKEKIIIEQSKTAMKELDAKIKDVAKQPGNVGRIDFSIRKGELHIDGDGNKIEMVIKGLSALYSEPGVEIEEGVIKIKSEEGLKENNVSLILEYSSLNIQFNEQDAQIKFSSAPLPYKFSIENKNNYLINIVEG